MKVFNVALLATVALLGVMAVPMSLEVHPQSLSRRGEGISKRTGDKGKGKSEATTTDKKKSDSSGSKGTTFPTKWTAGIGTYYGSEGGTGSCGGDLSGNAIAVSPVYMSGGNPNEDPLCGKSVQIKVGGKTMTFVIKDTCPSCGPTHIDILEDAAFELFPNFKEKGKIELSFQG
ncbi:hypothetical protein IWQ60_012086 [Tieghemiomyces parasiticus]|uniref:RlpA-like protein double-psi beta-barrel domain-containing protein n=1 Tax=Tieghemiomyces parasiticus TaxID=78921 RepID=A0A9W7ZLP8_9FUNG|nr:hypothetical protein IWQ60_012086 [Tieghemiomyces parasiticus]